MATQRTKIYIEGVALDLDKNIDTSLTYAIADIADFEKRTTTFSKTVSIPGTAHNSFLFGNYFDFNINNDYLSTIDNVGVNFNPFKKAFCKVTIDNVEVFAGVLRLLEIKYMNNVLYYECALFGSLGGLFSALGDKLLTDLELSDLDHIFDLATIKATWTASNPKYVYPLGQYGLGTSVLEDKYDVKNFRPAIFVYDMVDRIINQAGYTYNSDLWDNNNLNKMIILNGEEIFSRFFSNYASATFSAVEAAPIAPLGFSTVSATTPLAFDTITGGYERVKNISANPVSIKFSLSIGYDSPFFGVLNYEVRNDLTITTVKSSGNSRIEAGTGTFRVVYNITLDPGDGVNFYVRCPLSSGGVGFLVTSDSTLNAQAEEAGKKNPVTYGDPIDGRSIVPEGIKQSDFLKSVINLLNLYITQDVDNEFNLTFTPYPDFYSTERVDWSSKKDLKSGFSIKPPSEFTPNQYSFRYKDDVDYYSKLYKNKYAIGYGNLDYNTGNEFSKDTNATEFIFSLVPSISNILNDRILPAMFDINNDGTYKQIKTNPKLCFWGGEKDTNSDYEIYNGATLLSTEDTYPYAGHIYDPYITEDGSLWDLCFKAPSEIYFTITNYPVQNLFKKYYEQFMFDKINKDSKLITLYFLINSMDIMALDFRKLVKVDSGLYYLNKIEDYNPLGNELTKVELLRIA